jgi:sarcosine oxidase
MARTWDAIVVGLGGFGSAAAYWLARRSGSRILGLEQFVLGHDRGASSDHSRIIRLSYHRPDYVRLARRAYVTWAELEADAGVRVVTRTGGLDLFPPGAAISASDYTESMAAEGVSFERLDAAETMRRWPAWRLYEGTLVIHQVDAGIADPYRANAAHQRRARELGATLLDGVRVTALREQGGEVVVTTAGGETHLAGHVVLAADAWTNDLLAAFDRRLPLTITREQVTYYEPRERADDFSPDRFPVWIWMDDPSFYGFPTYGEPGPKAGQDVGGQVTTADGRDFEPDRPCFDRLTGFLDRHLPGMAGRELLTKTCLYTLTPDRDFVIDRLPDHANVTVLLGAAHGFKFASLVGQIAAELALDGQTRAAGDIAAFAMDRPILREAAPATSFLV